MPAIRAVVTEDVRADALRNPVLGHPGLDRAAEALRAIRLTSRANRTALQDLLSFPNNFSAEDAAKPAKWALERGRDYCNDRKSRQFSMETLHP